MRACHLMIDAWVGGILLALTASPSCAQDDPAEAIAGLRQVANDLTNSIKRFQTHLDQEITAHDRGYRTEAGRRIPGADADLFGGPPIVAQDAVRKLFTARMIAVRKPGYEPVALTDADRIQFLISKARDRIVMANRAMREFMMISAKDLNSASVAGAKVTRLELLRARDAAADAAKKALVILPVELPAADTPAEQKETAWDLVEKNTRPALPQQAASQQASSQQASVQQGAPENAIELPVRLEPGKKIVLIQSPYRRIALTDSGMEDTRGRRLFYQERWEQSMGVTSVIRWAVAVNPATGQHTLLRRYETREFRDELEPVYQFHGRDDLLQVKSPVISSPASTQEMKAATVELARAKEDLNDALVSYKRQLQEALARNDASLAAQDKPALDGELPNSVREHLFAIRAHMARTASILDAEDAVRRAAEHAAGRLRTLDAAVAWVNGDALERESSAGDSRALLEALNRSDSEINLTRSLALEALAALPPEDPGPEARFPALMKDAIVRIRGVRDGPSAIPPGFVRCRQEVWMLAGWARNDRQVKRTIIFVDVGRQTSSQIPAGREVRYYSAGPDDILEGIYDQYSAQQ